VASSSPGRWREYHLDHLGSPRLVTGPIGLKEAEYHPFPFGEMAAESGPAMEAREGLFRYTGHQRDTNCEGCAEEAQDDLDYMLARFYSPRVGRFLGVDPADRRKAYATGQTWNRYVYGSNNPNAFIDPDGRESVGIQLDIVNRAWLNGEMTTAELQQWHAARGAALAIGLTAFFGGHAFWTGSAALVRNLPLIQGFFMRPEVIQAGNQLAAALAEQGTPGPINATVSGFELTISRRLVGKTFRQTITFITALDEESTGNFFGSPPEGVATEWFSRGEVLGH